jgi:hypothetical protein
MTRTMARRGAPVLIAAALFGGVLATGGGTASAAEAPPKFGSENGDLYLGSTSTTCYQTMPAQCYTYSNGVLEILSSLTKVSFS